MRSSETREAERVRLEGAREGGKGGRERALGFSSSARCDEAPKVMELRDGFLCRSWSSGEEFAW